MIEQAIEQVVPFQARGRRGNRLPQSLDAERSVIGGVLLHPPAFSEVADLVAPEDFFHPTLAAIYRAMIDLDAKGRPIDTLTVLEQMKAAQSDAMLRAVGGPSFFGELQSDVVSVVNLAYHAQIVRGKAVSRSLIVAGQEIAARGMSEDALEADEHLEAAEQVIFGISQRAQRSAPQSLKMVLRTTVNAIEQRYTKAAGAVTGVPTDFSELDALTAGWHPAHLVILAARPSMGKTAMVMNAAFNAACNHRIPVLVFSLEMAKEELVERLLCSEARINSMRLRRGALEQRDWIQMTKAASRIADAPMWIDDTPAPTLLEIRAKARRWRSDAALFTSPDQLGLVVLDYLQLVQARRQKRDVGREREISETSRGLKALAKELRCPVVALSQLNRECESRTDKRPQLSDLRESGAIEQDADVVSFIYRDEVYNKETEDKGVAEVIVAKQRSGPLGVARLAFLHEYTRFENLRERDH